MPKTSVVLGLQYGDEGKGATVAHLSTPNTLVVRFNAGQQAGHTVVHENGHRHIFSTFGAGTMNGAHTYISEYCTFYPKSCYNERMSLNHAGFMPVLFIHPMTMVTTPFDIDANRSQEDMRINKHGSVGMGFGSTIQRNEESPYKLYAIDLINRPLLLQKLRNIAVYWKGVDIEKQIEDFLYYVDHIALDFRTLNSLSGDYENIIFEGAQGIMLDMDFGYFPNVTRSNTTSKNAIRLIIDNGLNMPDVYYVMRSYLTRHGNGFMPNERPDLNYIDITNKVHKYQGAFRQGEHSLEQLKYAIQCDRMFSGYAIRNKAIVITCLDQTDHHVLIDKNMYTPLEVASKLNFISNNVLISTNPSGILS